MTVSVRPATASAPPAAPAATAEPGLEARLAARLADMTVRLEEAAVAHEVRTAHLSTDPVDLADVITTPYTPGTRAAVPPPTYRTPVAALLERAQHRMETAGWCRGALTDQSGAVCLMGAIRAEAHGDDCLAGDAVGVLMDAIHREFGEDVPSIPWFNDRQRNGRTPARMLQQAASLADARLL